MEKLFCKIWILFFRTFFFQIGDKIPSVDLYENTPGNKVNSTDAFGKGKCVVFAVPGAFTPGCSKVTYNS